MQKANLNLFTGTFRFPFSLPGEEPVWIICRDCVFVECVRFLFFFVFSFLVSLVLFFLSFFFLFKNADLRCIIMKLLWSPENHNKWTFLRSICAYRLTIRAPVLLPLSSLTDNLDVDNRKPSPPFFVVLFFFFYASFRLSPSAASCRLLLAPLACFFSPSLPLILFSMGRVN